MKSRVLARVGMTTVLGAAAVLGVRAQTSTSAVPALTATRVATITTLAIGEEHHPEMHEALRNLERSKENLEKARRDYDGHRAKALDLVRQAIAEVKLGLELS